MKLSKIAHLHIPLVILICIAGCGDKQSESDSDTIEDSRDEIALGEECKVPTEFSSFYAKFRSLCQNSRAPEPSLLRYFRGVESNKSLETGRVPKEVLVLQSWNRIENLTRADIDCAAESICKE